MSQPSPTPEPSETDYAAGAAIAGIVAAQAARRAQLTRQAIAMATASARAFTGWYDSDAITAWASGLAARIETVQRNQARATDVYFSRVLTHMLGRRVRPLGAIPVGDLRTGVTHAGAYGRGADAYRWQQSQLDHFARDLANADIDVKSPDLIDPVEAAVQRVASVADLDMQLADRAQSAAVLQEHADKHQITGWRRVIHPERSKGGTCGLCIAASDRIYHVKDLKPIHGRCECAQLPIVQGVDPGSGLNNLDLRDLYKQADGSTSAASLKRTRYQIDEHGELGPVLNPAGAKVRTARQAARDTNPSTAPKSPAQKQAALARARDSLAKALPRARELAGSDAGAWGKYLTQLEARIADLDHQLAA